MNRAFLKVCLVTLALLVMAEPGYSAPGEVAHVVWVKGGFSASGRSLQRNSPIFLHDVLYTGAGSQAQIVFTDNTLMTFKESSQYSIDSYQFKKKAPGSFTGTLAAGGFRTITGAIAKANPHNYQVNTPVATIGVRGTDYQTVYSNGYLYTMVYQGTVCITPYGAPAQAACPIGLSNAIQNMNVPC